MAGWLIALGVLAILASIPLGASARYDEHGPLVKLIIGSLRLTLYPRPKKGKKEEKQEQPEQKKQRQKKSAPKEEPQEQPREKNGGSFTDFLPLVKTALDMLGAFRRKLRVNRMELKLTMAADDPCDLAVNYGRAWAAVGNLMPQLERLFVIKKRDVEVQCDFTASETKIYTRLDLTITLGRLISLGVVYGIRALKDFLNIRKKRKGGAVK